MIDGVVGPEGRREDARRHRDGAVAVRQPGPPRWTNGVASAMPDPSREAGRCGEGRSGWRLRGYGQDERAAQRRDRAAELGMLPIPWAGVSERAAIPTSANDEDGDRRAAHGAFGDAAEDEPLDRAHAARADDEDVGVRRGGERAPRAGGPSGPRSSRATRLARVAPWRLRAAVAPRRRAPARGSPPRWPPRAHASGHEPGGGQPDGLDDAEQARLAAPGRRETGDERHGIARVRGAVDADQETARSPCRASHHQHGAGRLPHARSGSRFRGGSARRRPGPGSRGRSPARGAFGPARGFPATGGASVTTTSASGQRRRRRCSAR